MVAAVGQVIGAHVPSSVHKFSLQDGVYDFPSCPKGAFDLESQVAHLREEAVALRHCLETSGLLCPQRFLAQVHRQRFTATRHAHPFVCQAGLVADVLHTRGIALAIAGIAGLSSVRALRAASGIVRRVTALAQADVARLFPYLGDLYIVGGEDGSQVLDSAEHFDSSTGSWEALPPMCTRRRGAAAAILDGQVFVLGGHDGSECLSSAERFFPDTGIWQELPSMQIRRREAAVAGIAGCIFVMGGFDGTRCLNCVECYRTGNVGGGDAWEVAPPLLERRWAAAAATLGGRVYTLGGTDGTWPLSSVERLTSHWGQWERIPSMLGRRYGAAASVAGGRLCIFGGLEGPQALSSAEHFDPAIGFWEPLPQMARRRRGLAAVAIASHIYILGGHDGEKCLGSVERLDPLASSSSWEVLPPLLNRRVGAAAVGITH